VGQIFISYRRDDAAGHAGRLYDQLQEDLVGEHIFMDVDAIEPGVDFVQRIEAAVASADVFLAVVGRSWVTVTDEEGRRRLDDPNDYVRREVGTALGREMTVIPVLVGGAAMPKAGQLPDELVPLTRRNALVLSDLEWGAGIRKLVATLRKAMKPEPVPEPAPPPIPPEQDDGAAEPAAVQTVAPLMAGFAGAAMLVGATALRWDALVDPDFGGGTVPNLGAFTAPASVAVAVGVVFALLRAWRHDADPLSTGLLLGFSVGGIAKYLSLIGLRSSEGSDAFGSGASLALGLIGSLITAAVAIYWLVTRNRQRSHSSPLVGRVLAPVGAILIAAATMVPFNISTPVRDPAEQVILERSAWEALDAFLLAVAIVAAILLAGEVKRVLVSGIFIALGILAALYYVRYIGVPALQMLDQDDLASIRAGGFVGLAGAVLVWRAGVVGRDRPGRS
jgi:TIR domain